MSDKTPKTEAAVSLGDALRLVDHDAKALMVDAKALTASLTDIIALAQQVASTSGKIRG